MIRLLSVIGLALFLISCASVPRGLTPVGDFDSRRYLGTWYEIARFDHSFERGLTHVRATYAAMPDGRIEVLNSGFDTGKKSWREIRGTARMAGELEKGSLLVSFFPPFESGYHVIALDRQSYRWAIVAGPNRKFLWLLSRTPSIDARLRAKLWHLVEEAGYDPALLIEVPQNDTPPFTPRA